ncbi:MAG TPA: exodeoxyribonuclease VII large subunit [Cyclobacteriaceae bacterium]|nr:exodeoxyribonuclease VII large subunit [Cyclobacteriaceae bacterium]
MTGSVEKGVKHIRLSELNQKITTVIFGAFNNLSFWVVADVTSHSFRDQTGSHNFELVEKDPVSHTIVAKIRGKAWGNGTLRIEAFERQTGQKFTNNINVLVNVSVEFHPVYGLQLNLNDIDPAFTLGMLEQQRLSILEALVIKNPGFISKVGERFITRNNQLKLKAVLQKIAIISSKTSAGGEDFLHTLENNPFGYKFTVDHYHTAVQGENNAEQFLQKIIEVFNSGKEYDVVVITRGGGAQTDFLMFDNYNIGRAVARFPIPIITGIGHQRNETIADLMAHTQTKTPTKAAEFIIAHNKSYEDGMIDLQRRIIIRTQQRLSRSQHELVEIRQNTIDTARSVLFHHQKMLSNRSSNLQIFIQQYLKNKKGYVAHLVSMIKLMAPDSIMKRGFAIVKSGDKVISNANDLEAGSKIDIILSGDKINATVNQKMKNDGSEFNI